LRKLLELGLVEAPLSHEKAAAGGWDSDGFFPM
jgi:hypothetical protein